ncbi:MAG: DUF108 domain-containing protein [Rhodobacteraceae bacterium]|jgi:predicted dinucleotide-utilizing enzyme|nr:DUF108 domain-containing protein [Paracoccaceae bacterium]
MRRVGIIGAGFVARHLYAGLAGPGGAAEWLAPAFVWARRPDETGFADPAHRLERLGDAPPADLVVEAAHPDLSRSHGAAFLARGDYMPLSVTALADDALRGRLVAAARAAGTRLLLPAGALVGGQALLAVQPRWAEVTITFRKHPASIDFSAAGIDPAAIRGATVLHDGPVRSIAARFPRNVNTMVTCALVSLGLDATRAVLVADPALDHGVAELRALGIDGSELFTRKRQPMAGVSGTEMAASVLRSVRLALGAGAMALV